MRRLVACLLALLVLAGCSVQPDPDETDPGPDTPGLDEPLPAQPEAPDYPEVFSLAYHRDQSLDPITCGEGLSLELASLLYEPLFQLDSSFSPIPLLCQDYIWNQEGTALTLTVRQDVTFSDGSALTSRDVAETLRRAAASERYGYRLRSVTGVTNNSRAGTVTITLVAPDRGFPALLDIPIVKYGTENRQIPVGTGPYLLSDGDDGACLTARDDWWQGKALPVDRIALVHAKDHETAANLFASHQVELLAADLTAGLELPACQADAAERPTAIMQFIGFNAREGRLFASAALRAAFSLGLQRELLADALLSGHAVAAQFPVSPLSPLYPKSLERPYDGDQTLDALRAAGADSGEARQITLLVNSANRYRLAEAEFIADSMSLLDLEITVEALPWEEYLARLESGDFDLYLGEVRLTANWDISDLAASGGSLNYGGYASESTDFLLASLAAREDRAAAVSALCTHLRNQCPFAPLCFRSTTVLTHPGIAEGVSPSPGSVFYGLEDWTIHLANEQTS